MALFSKKRGNILITFVLIMVLALVVFSLYFVISGRLRSATGGANYSKALYVAEAGIHKAIWNIITPVSQGGMGTGWRTAGLNELYGEGMYTMIVENTADPDEILVTSSAEVAGIVRKVQVKLVASSLPAAFDYALYNNGNLNVGGSVTIKGDVFADGNITVNNPAKVSGEVFVPEGNTISGSGQYTVGGELTDPPEMPFLNTSYYDGYITTAGLQPAGNLTLDNYNLNGQTIYVNGNVTIKGTLTGTGRIVASGDISFNNTTTPVSVEYIAGNTLQLSGNSNISDCLLFSSNGMNITGNPRVEGTILSSTITIAGTPSIFGIIYAWQVGVTLGTANIYGTLVNPTNQTITGNISIVYDPAYLPASPPPGMTAGGYSIVRGSWKEL
jgi:cytoskeletal protein CcmA (bactofilin family)